MQLMRYLMRKLMLMLLREENLLVVVMKVCIIISKRIGGRGLVRVVRRVGIRESRSFRARAGESGKGGEKGNGGAAVYPLVHCRKFCVFGLVDFNFFYSRL